MNKLNQLIERLCPNGVEFKRLSDLINYVQPTKYIVNSTKYDNSYEIPVLTPGQTFILGYTNETDNIYKANFKKPIILFDDFTTAFRWIDFNFKVKSSAVKILIPQNDNVNFKFVFYAMQTIKINYTEHGRKWISKFSQIKIPVPPMEVQREIVHILDDFTLYIAELTAELTARKKQYEYYQNKLLQFDNKSIMLKLGEVGPIKMCKRILKSQTNTLSGIPFFKIGTFGKKEDAYIKEDLFEEYKNKYSYPKKGDILISCSGTIGRTVIFDGKPAYFQDSNIVWIQNDERKVLNKYLFYCYKKCDWKVSKGGTIVRLYNDNIAKTEIPVPSLEEQERIVNILDRFDKLCNDISEGLPAEIEARKKQYEYYRDKLLTFKELKNN